MMEHTTYFKNVSISLSYGQLNLVIAARRRMRLERVLDPGSFTSWISANGGRPRRRPSASQWPWRCRPRPWEEPILSNYMQCSDLRAGVFTTSHELITSKFCYSKQMMILTCFNGSEQFILLQSLRIIFLLNNKYYYLHRKLKPKCLTNSVIKQKTIKIIVITKNMV